MNLSTESDRNRILKALQAQRRRMRPIAMVDFYPKSPRFSTKFRRMMIFKWTPPCRETGTGAIPSETESRVRPLFFVD